MTLGVLGGDNFVVDLETDVDNNKVEEEIQIETHDCPPCLCLLDHDRDNYFIDSPQQEQENVVTTTTTTTSTTTTTTTTTTSTTTTTTSTTTTSTTSSDRVAVADGDVCLSESCVMAAGNTELEY